MSLTIQLPKELEILLISKIHGGLFPSLDAAMTRAAYLLLEQIENGSDAKSKLITIEELHQRMIAEGKITQLPDTAADFDDPDDLPITIEGEPLSETIIRERR